MMTTPTTEPIRLTILLETVLRQLVSLLQVILESIAVLIVLYAVFVVLGRLFRRRRGEMVMLEIRLEMGLYLGMSLEFLLAADIVGTAISPSWDVIGKLAAITAIRTFLNYFLQKEVQELETKTHPLQ